MGRQRGVTGKKYNDAALKAEFIASGLSLNAFITKYGGDMHLYKIARRDGWAAEKKKVVSRALKKVSTQASNLLADEWKNYLKLWQAVQGQAVSILKNTVGPDGRITQPLAASDLASLARAIETALKGEALIRGLPTERTENRNLNMNLFADLVDAVKERNADHGVSEDFNPEG